jgi:uncharacterized protein YndB with AHSA1/START domain
MGDHRDFDFIFGKWQVHNHKLRDVTDPDCTEWVDFDATSEAYPVLGGLGHVDRMFVPEPPDGPPFEGFTLRLFDPATEIWRIWWSSTRAPGRLDTPVEGRFDGNAGVFTCRDQIAGQPVDVRFEWTADPSRPTWRQSFRRDGDQGWRLNWQMDLTRRPAAEQSPRIVSASRDIAAAAETIFELIAEPTQQPRWDGNDNLRHAGAGQRVHAVGDVFTMTLRRGGVRENTIIEFDEGRLIAWRPNVPGRKPPGHLWRWQLEPIEGNRTRVTQTYDWTGLTDRSRYPRARATTVERLAASLERLAHLAEHSGAAENDPDN